MVSMSPPGAPGRPPCPRLCLHRGARRRLWIDEQFPRMPRCPPHSLPRGAGRDYLCVLILLIEPGARLLCPVSLRKCSRLLSPARSRRAGEQGWRRSEARTGRTAGQAARRAGAVHLPPQGPGLGKSGPVSPKCLSTCRRGRGWARGADNLPSGLSPLTPGSLAHVDTTPGRFSGKWGWSIHLRGLTGGVGAPPPTCPGSQTRLTRSSAPAGPPPRGSPRCLFPRSPGPCPPPSPHAGHVGLQQSRWFHPRAFRGSPCCVF